jgi:hypothetical protein
MGWTFQTLGNGYLQTGYVSGNVWYPDEVFADELAAETRVNFLEETGAPEPIGLIRSDEKDIRAQEYRKSAWGTGPFDNEEVLG